MASSRIIKKYPNRRLYDTETSTYITLAEVKDLVMQYKDFQVQDAKTGDDLTRSILLQIILEEESGGGLPMFSSDLLSQLIRFYGNAMQGVMGTYLEKNRYTFAPGERIRVRGWNSHQHGARVFLAADVHRGDAVWRFRRPDGRVLWIDEK